MPLHSFQPCHAVPRLPTSFVLSCSLLSSCHVLRQRSANARHLNYLPPYADCTQKLSRRSCTATAWFRQPTLFTDYCQVFIRVAAGSITWRLLCLLMLRQRLPNYQRFSARVNPPPARLRRPVAGPLCSTQHYQVAQRRSGRTKTRLVKSTGRFRHAVSLTVAPET
jgi:hypothetical protein